jgi:hypothetical protein
MEAVEPQPFFEVFRPSKLQQLVSRLESAKGFEFELGSKMVQEMGSSAEGSKNPTTQTNTLKFVGKVAAEVMQVDKVTKLFQIMAIMNLNMGNLTLEVNNLKNRLATREKDKVVL